MLAAKIIITRDDSKDIFITKIKGAASEKPFAEIETKQPFTMSALRNICNELNIVKVIVDGPVAPEGFPANWPYSQQIF